MAHNPTNRRKLALHDPLPSSQTTLKRQINPSNTSTSTIYNLTNHFSRLHPNPSKPTNSLPQKHIDNHLQTKSFSNSLNLEPSKSSSLLGQKHGKRVSLEIGVKNNTKSLVFVDEKRESKKLESDESKKSGVAKNSKLMMVKEKQRKIVVNDGNNKRRSFSDVQIELGNFLVTNCAKVVSADMPPFMQIHVVGFARKIKDSLEKFSSKNLALSLKKELDGVYGPAWHCIVGTSFGSFVTHSVGGFLYFSLDQKWYVLLFKTNVQRADS